MDAKNTRRDVSLKPKRIEVRKKGHAKYAVIVGIAMVLLLSGLAGIITMAPHNMATRHTISVDANPNDWSGTLPNTANSYAISNGEYVWNDSVNDERNDFNGGNPDDRVDLTEFRITGDSSYIYFLAEFKNMSSFHLGDNGATWMAIAIDNGTSGGETWFAGNSNTTVNSSAAWEYQVVVNLADSRYTGKGLNFTEYPLNESTANWGSIFYVINNTWKFVDYTGDTGQHGLMAVNLTNNTIEIRLAWSVIGLNPTDLPTLRVSVITARGYSDYSKDSGNVWSTSSGGFALDCITTTGPNTWDEVQDGEVNDYITVTFDSSGDVSNGDFVPEFNALILPVLLVLIVPVFLRRTR